MSDHVCTSAARSRPLSGARAWVLLLIAALSATALGCRSAASTPPPSSPPEQPTESDTRPAEPHDADDMVSVPAGTFLMGTPEDELSLIVELCRQINPAPTGCNRERLIAHHRNETPQREVYVSGFSIGRNEVTNAEYERCVSEGGCTARDFDRCVFFAGREHVHGGTLDEVQARDDHPVVCVSWEQAAAYCQHAGGALPTEAQWEKAARGVDGRVFPWGNDWNPLGANWAEGEHTGSVDGYVTTSPVGSFPAGASPYGALDMVGNVWEWVADRYAEDAYAQGAASDPQGPETGTGRVMRGGGYAAQPLAQRTAKRVPRDPPEAYVNIGFRCARPAQ
ncbi:formylglycine-generating enzyme family protein [Haliangium sp.]|uniref:formylglycine-generating enzyme family protein n=1 Tax=Haliangium sp. TaxID=2663208 RepID=UPI003D0EFA6E